MNELHEGQRVQLDRSVMSPERRDMYPGYKNGVVIGFHGEYAWVRFDGGWRALFSVEELKPTVEQIGLFAEVQA